MVPCLLALSSPTPIRQIRKPKEGLGCGSTPTMGSAWGKPT